MFLYVSITKRLLNYGDSDLTPKNYGWKTEGYVLCSQKHQVFMSKEYTVSCKCQRSCTGTCICKSLEESTEKC